MSPPAARRPVADPGRRGSGRKTPGRLSRSRTAIPRLLAFRANGSVAAMPKSQPPIAGPASSLPTIPCGDQAAVGAFEFVAVDQPGQGGRGRRVPHHRPDAGDEGGQVDQRQIHGVEGRRDGQRGDQYRPERIDPDHRSTKVPSVDDGTDAEADQYPRQPLQSGHRGDR